MTDVEMKPIIFDIQSKDVPELGAILRDIPKNEDGLKVLLIRYKGRVNAWINSCPHDGRPLCRDPVYLWHKQKKMLQCMNHQALFNPESGECEMGPCIGSFLLSLKTKEMDGRILVYN